jgi:hypothetical protein
MRRAAGAWVAATAALLLAAVPAAADEVDDAVSALRSAHVFVAPGAEAGAFIDSGRLGGLIGAADLRIAVLPASAQGVASTQETAARLQAELGDAHDIVVAIIGRKVSVATGGAAALSAADVAAIVSTAYGRHSEGGFTQANVEGALEEIVTEVKAAGPARSTSGGGSGHSAAVAGFLLVLALGAGTGGLWYGLHRRAARRVPDDPAAGFGGLDGLGYVGEVSLSAPAAHTWAAGHDASALATWAGGDWGTGAGSSWGRDPDETSPAARGD